MEILSLAILLSTILFLIDKNQKWATFWKVIRYGGFAVVAFAVVASSAFYFYDRHQAAKALERKGVMVFPAPTPIDLSAGLIPNKKAPDTLPKDFNNWDKPEPAKDEFDKYKRKPTKP